MKCSNKQISWSTLGAQSLEFEQCFRANIQDSRIDRSKLNCEKFRFIVVKLSHYLKLWELPKLGKPTRTNRHYGKLASRSKVWVSSLNRVIQYVIAFLDDCVET